MRNEKRRAAAANPTLSTPPSDNSDHNEHTDEFKLDRMLVGDDSEIWARLFDGEFRLAVKCSRCGRWLTNGASKRNRLGSHCAKRVSR